MGVRKSSRIVTMKHEYQIKNDSVTEFENDLYNGNWSFFFLRKHSDDFLVTNRVEVVDSFMRTKKWVLENHMEMLL